MTLVISIRGEHVYLRRASIAEALRIKNRIDRSGRFNGFRAVVVRTLLY